MYRRHRGGLLFEDCSKVDAAKFCKDPEDAKNLDKKNQRNCRAVVEFKSKLEILMRSCTRKFDLLLLLHGFSKSTLLFLNLIFN